MLAFSIQGVNVKDFMQHLFVQDSFCRLEVRGIVLHSFTHFEISGEKDGGAHCIWEELRPYVRHILKGRDKPKAMKLIFAQPEPESFHPNAAALFINIAYEGADEGKITCTTATAQKQFDMDKSLDRAWDGWVAEFFKQHDITMTLV